MAQPGATRLLGEAAPCRLLIPAVDLTQGKTVVFKTPHQPGFVRDRRMRVVDVLLAIADEIDPQFASPTRGERPRRRPGRDR